MRERTLEASCAFSMCVRSGQVSMDGEIVRSYMWINGADNDMARERATRQVPGRRRRGDRATGKAKRAKGLAGRL